MNLRQALANQSSHARLATWMVFAILVSGPVMAITIVFTLFMLFIGLWIPEIPLASKLATPLGFVALWFEFRIASAVLNWCTKS